MAWIDWYKTVEEQLADLLTGTDSDGTAVPDRKVTLDGEAVVLGAGATHVGAFGGHTVRKALTMSLDTNAYADGDLLAEMQEVDAAVRIVGGTGWLIDVAVLDEDDNAGALDVVIAASEINLGVENSAVSVSDADAREILGIVEIGAGDYVDLIGSQRASVEVKVPLAGLAADSIWVGIISRDTKTYTAAGLRVYLGILQD